MHSILIAGANKNKRLKKAKLYIKTDIKNDLDTRILEPDPSITIKQIREAEIFLSKKAKLEIEALTSKGLKFLIDKYIPEKIETGDYID